MRPQSGPIVPPREILLAERLSSALAGGALALAPLIRRVRPEVGEVLDARRGADAALAEWGRSRPAGIVVWLHGASAGELLGAAPAIDELRATRPLSLAVTHFSPSGRAALDRLAPDVASFAPFDRRPRCERAMAAVRPDLLVFAKLDVWPGLVGAATRAGVPVCLINGVVRERSRRRGAASRRLLRSTYARLAAVGAATEGDLAHLRSLGVRLDAGRVTGDAAFDLAIACADAARRHEGGVASLPARPPRGARLVAGSTWPEDEAALLDALDTLPERPDGRFGWQVVLVPHRPTEARVRALEGRARARGQPVARWSRPDEVAALPAHGIVLVDEVGRLVDLYAAADVAYVGGGLGTRGLHNVLEPAAAGIPVLFGRRHDRGDAFGLERSGGGTPCGPEDLAGALRRFGPAAERTRPGRLAREYVEAGAGAAVASAALMASLLPDG